MENNFEKQFAEEQMERLYKIKSELERKLKIVNDDILKYDGIIQEYLKLTGK